MAEEKSKSAVLKALLGASEEETRRVAMEVELSEVRERLWRQQQEYEGARKRLAEDYSQREKELMESVDSLTKNLRQREKDLEKARIDHNNKYLKQSREVQELRRQFDEEKASWITERALKDEQLALERQLFEEERAKYDAESRDNLRVNSAEFVDETVSSLKFDKWYLLIISKFWSIVGGGSIVLAALFVSWLSFKSLEKSDVVISWQLLAFYAIKGVVITSFVLAISRYSFLLSAKYMDESLRTSDRLHAIKFGQFYIRSYGVSADWGQVKEAFEHWNINVSRVDGKKDGELINIDLPIVEKLLDLVGKLRGS